jgi:chemotaxis protein MotA
MFFIIGAIIVVGCVIGGYMANGGHMAVLWQPFEFLIILGAGVGGFIISNPKKVLSETGAAFGIMFKGTQYGKQDYLDLLKLLYIIFKTLKSKGALAIESHIESPKTSEIFNKFPKFCHNHYALDFVCDYLRLLTMNVDNPLQIENLMELQLDCHHKDQHRVCGAIQALADSTPALGIVAAVLGVIHTMGSITEPPEVLGHLIGGALVGTFFGVLVAYGFVGPIATSIRNICDLDSKYYECLKMAILAYLNGFAPLIAVEFGRKVLPHDVQPSFAELESTCDGAE